MNKKGILITTHDARRTTQEATSKVAGKMAEALLPFCQAIKKLKGPSAGRWC